ncbi:MAG: phosphoribosylformylglycinamidine cyclo-ligase [bacterium]
MKKKLTYSDAGVDVKAANLTKQKIKELAHSTYNGSVLTELGSFGGLYDLSAIGIDNPVLVSSVDGVGTKLKLAFMTGNHKGVGRDIVCHCINDILVQGAKPLFFMDYIAMGRHDSNVIQQIIASLASACRDNNCALLGGEMAEMPDFYKDGEYDLAGMIVGVVDKSSIIDGSTIAPGDIVMGMGSSGLHTNGYSLARKALLEIKGFSLSDQPEILDGITVAQALLEPHKSYLDPVMETLKFHKIKGLAHITGGGFEDNIVRVLPHNCRVVIDPDKWKVPPIFTLIEEAGEISKNEMFRTFNMGIGMVAFVDPGFAADVLKIMRGFPLNVFEIGFVEKSLKGVKIL